MLVLEYISTHGPFEWCAVQMSARESKSRLPGVLATLYIMYRRVLGTAGSTPCERDPLQLAEHSSDATGVVPAVAARHCTISSFCVCVGPIRQRHIPRAV